MEGDEGIEFGWINMEGTRERGREGARIRFFIIEEFKRKDQVILG